MADIFLASILLIGGIAWAAICVAAAASHPTPSQADFGPLIFAGPIAALIGLLWWVWIIIGWVI